jgi:hypothetical protein
MECVNYLLMVLRLPKEVITLQIQLEDPEVIFPAGIGLTEDPLLS